MNKNIFIPIAIIVFSLSVFASFKFFSSGTSLIDLAKNPTSDYTPPTANGGAVDTTGPKTEECPINGEMLTKGQRALWETRRPLAIMIENHTEARPQSGLTSADVVYEAVAEGGITRFATIFYCKDATQYVGPVRSARVYFIDLISEYGNYPLYTHVGGANCNESTGSGCGGGAPADALGKLNKLGWTGYNDLNFISFPVMWRDYERLPGVATEHTVYSTTQKLWDYAKKSRKLTNVDEDGEKWDEDFTKWKFKDEKPSTATVSKISFDFWEGKADFSVSYAYDKLTNSYKRSNGGAPHMDKNNSKQISPKNVVIAFMDESVAKDGYDAGQHMLYKTSGEGDAIVFQDGQAIKGTWEKKDAFTRIRFYDTKGKEISFNRGQIFIEIVPTGNTIKY